MSEFNSNIDKPLFPMRPKKVWDFKCGCEGDCGKGILFEANLDQVDNKVYIDMVGYLSKFPVFALNWNKGMLLTLQKQIDEMLYEMGKGDN